MENRLDAFEKMLAAVQTDYAAVNSRMAQLKEAGREKSATYRQLMGNKMQLQELLDRYRTFGLLD